MEIPLTQGKVAIIDEADWPVIAPYTWCVKRCGTKYYAVTNIDCKTVYMHRLLTGFPLNDHINNDSLDNRRGNLRSCTRSQNMFNSDQNKICRSQYKGVSWHPTVDKWRARINVKGKEVHLGTFLKEEEAAEAYKAAAARFFGEFARF